MIDAHIVHCVSPRHGVRSRASDHLPPVCARFAHLDWGYEAFSLSEAVSVAPSSRSEAVHLRKNHIAPHMRHNRFTYEARTYHI